MAWHPSPVTVLRVWLGSRTASRERLPMPSTCPSGVSAERRTVFFDERTCRELIEGAIWLIVSPSSVFCRDKLPFSWLAMSVYTNRGRLASFCLTKEKRCNNPVITPDGATRISSPRGWPIAYCIGGDRAPQRDRDWARRFDNYHQIHLASECVAPAGDRTPSLLARRQAR